MSDGVKPALDGIRVIDMSDEFGSYAGRLLVGLGAEVIRIYSSQDAGSGPPPYLELEEGPVSLFTEFVDAGKRLLYLDLSSEGDSAILEKLVESADVLLGSASGRAPGGWAEINASLVHVVITPFGWDHSPLWEPVDDLIVLGAGGLLHLGGYQDVGPIGAFGGQSYIAAGIFGAVAALLGLIEREVTAAGSHADVSAQEAIAQALEDSLPAYVLTGELRGPQGEQAKEAGTGIYECADGYVSMVAGRLGTARAWSALVDWVVEGGDEAEELLDEKWLDFGFRQTAEARERFRELFESFASSRPMESLYLEAQSRGIALSPVNNVEALLINEQLAYREFFIEVDSTDLGTRVTVPGSPFRLSANAQVVPENGIRGRDERDRVLSDLGIAPPDSYNETEK